MSRPEGEDEMSGDRGPRGHQEVWELLPWHAAGSLAPDESRAVDEHLARCPLCRRELEVCRRLAAAVAEAGELPLSPSHRFSRLAARLDEVEPGSGADAVAAAGTGGEAPGIAAPSGAVGPGGRRVRAGRRRAAGRAAGHTASRTQDRSQDRGPGRRLAASWRATPRGLRRLLLAQAAAVVLLAIAGLALVRPDGGAAAVAFQTLADPAASLPAAVEPGAGSLPASLTVRLVFREEASERQIRRVLRQAGGEIVAGPSATGVYTAAFPTAVNGGAAGDAGVERLLDRLRGQPAVALAEPVVVRRPPRRAAGVGAP